MCRAPSEKGRYRNPTRENGPDRAAAAHGVLVANVCCSPSLREVVKPVRFEFEWCAVTPFQTEPGFAVDSADAGDAARPLLRHGLYHRFTMRRDTEAEFVVV